MANYPDAIYDPRIKENDDGIEYAPEQTRIIFAEDVNKLDAEVVAVQTELGTDPWAEVEKTDDYTLALVDRKKIIAMNKETAVTLTVPPNASVAFPVRSVIVVRQTGAGKVSIAAGDGVTIQSQDNALDLVGQYAMATLVKVATNTWSLEGNVEN